VYTVDGASCSRPSSLRPVSASSTRREITGFNDGTQTTAEIGPSKIEEKARGTVKDKIISKILFYFISSKQFIKNWFRSASC
jgi:hypothetical protein